jgi:hypothetical protein
MTQPKPVHEGRIVYFENFETAGLVLAVHDDGTTVDIQIMRNGKPVNLSEVPYSEEPKRDHWSWHPDEPPAES